MRIGIPKELHDGERRVATTPEVAAQLQKLGFTVAVETGVRGCLESLKRKTPPRLEPQPI